MRVVTYLLYLSSFLPAPAYLFIIYDEGVCPATPLNSNVCQVGEAPTFQLIESRISDQVPVYISAKPSQHPMDFETRGYMYFLDEEREKPPHQILKGVTLDYLDMRGAKTISDLLKMDSREIVKPKKTDKLSQAWQIDEVQNLRGPQYLPDVVLESDLPQNDDKQHLNNQFLDENEKKLGRFVVEDVPPQNHDPKSVKNYLPLNNVESDPDYSITSHPKAPSIVVSSVVGISENIPGAKPPKHQTNLEPFVEYAMETSLEDTRIPEEIKVVVPTGIDPKEPEHTPYTSIGDSKVEEGFSMLTEQQTEPNVTTEMPVTTPTTTTMSNVVEKKGGDSKNNTSKKRPHKRSKKRKIKNHEEQPPVENNVGQSTDDKQKETKLEETTTSKNDIVEIKSRILVENDSVLDKLLTVM